MKNCFDNPVSLREPIPSRSTKEDAPVTYSDIRSLAWPEERDACGVGFVADVHGRKTHRILQQAIEALCNLSHRGAVSADGLTGDGAGILAQLPHKLFRRVLAEAGLELEHDHDLAVRPSFS